MPLDAWITLIVVAGCLGTMIFTRISPDAILLTGLTTLLVTGVLGVEEALSGFANTGLLAVAVLYVVATGLRQTGALDVVIKHVFGRPHSTAMAQLRMMAPVCAMSAVLNNTPIVATFLPAVLDWAKRLRISPSKLLILLSYAAILGGTCTLIGTSTNLIVHGLLEEQAGYSGFTFFELAWVGVPCVIVGVVYVLIFSRWLLPERVPVLEKLRDPREYTVEMLVEPHGPLDGTTIEAAGLRNLPGLFLVEIDRDQQIIAAVGPEFVLQGRDRLVFAGITDSIVDLRKIRGLVPATNQVFKLDAPHGQRTLMEAVVATNCPIIGKTIKQGRFRHIYNAVVIAVARNGQRIVKKIGDIDLMAGDTLLLEADPTFVERHRNNRDFLLVRPIEEASLPRHERSFVAWLILIGVVGVAALGVADILVAALVGALAMVMTGCLSITAARRSIELQVILAIGAAIGIANALAISGADRYLAIGVIDAVGNKPWLLLVATYAMTIVLTAIITNNAAAALMFPIVFAAVKNLGLDFMPFAVAITVAASAEFSTPIGYQTNLMVYGPGGYRFVDYLRFGLPLNFFIGCTTLLIIPQVWPLQ
ncbi:MAG: SLC13 family permease [Pseudomonadota bacterium]|nr:SLC13 family permease [Pseudomonadota bacterium]